MLPGRVLQLVLLVVFAGLVRPAAAQVAGAGPVSISADAPAAGSNPDGELQRVGARRAGLEHGLRSGLELGAGDIDAGNPFRRGALRSIAAYRVPIWLDLGYRLSAPWWIGTYAQVGSGAFGDSCPRAAECEWSDLRLGAQFTYHLSPNDPQDLWVGAGFGWQWLRGAITQTVEVPGPDDSTVTVPAKASELRGGPQLLVQGGLGWNLGETLRLGPYASAAAGMYLTDSFECSPGLPCDIDGRTELRLHAWFGLGVRATYGL
ncbi:MAG: hypothetical protein RJA70_2387 [Pseudomonadota bacterium]|jgi:hypothetical protein